VKYNTEYTINEEGTWRNIAFTLTQGTTTPVSSLSFSLSLTHMHARSHTHTHTPTSSNVLTRLSAYIHTETGIGKRDKRLDASHIERMVLNTHALN